MKTTNVIKIFFWKRKGFRGSGFRVQGSGFRIQGSEFRVQGSGFRVQGSGFRVQGSDCVAVSLCRCVAAPYVLVIAKVRPLGSQ